MQLILTPLTREAFAPFGRVIEPPEPGGETVLHDLLGPGLAAAHPCAKLDTHPPRSLPFSAPAMERHEHTEQLFVPMGPARFVVAVCLPGPDDKPDLATLRGFFVEGGVGICYARGVWHLPITILERPSTVLMMMLTTGDQAIDTSWATLPEPLEPQPVP